MKLVLYDSEVCSAMYIGIGVIFSIILVEKIIKLYRNRVDILLNKSKKNKQSNALYKPSEEVLYLYENEKNNIYIRVRCKVISVNKKRKNNENIYKVRALEGGKNILNISESNLIKIEV